MFADCAIVEAEAKGAANEDGATTGFDTRPEGPAVEGIQVVGDGITFALRGGKDVFQVNFPASGAKPAAVFSFKEADINDRLGMAIDIANAGRQPVRVYADLNGDTWVRGCIAVEPGKQGTLYVFARRKKLAAGVTELFPGMHGVPGGKMSLWAGIEEPIIAKQLRVFIVKPAADAKIEARNIRPFGSSKIPDLTNFFPFIDRYGQYKHKDWPGKTHSDADLKAARQREDADLAAHPAPDEFNRYGGWAKGPQLKATGHFRVEKREGMWWLVDPDGRLFWSHGLDVVGTTIATRTQGRERFYEDPAPMGNFLARNLQTKYGDNWRELVNDRLLRRLRSWGMNTLGAWSDRDLAQKQKIPYTLALSSAERGGRIDPDSAAWSRTLRQNLTAAAARANSDPWCIGFFVDNEIHVSSDPAWWERYYRQVGAAAKEFMPNKLYLGSRLDYHDWPDVAEARKEIVRHAAKYCDVIGFNFYKLTLDDVALPEGVDRPAIIGEFHFGALDRGLFHTGLRSVLDQKHRAEAYRHYVAGALRNPAIVGAHWFQCYDEPTTGRFDGENYQIGFLDNCDTPYQETIAAAREVGVQIYAIRAAKE
ncbi:MAG: hypothetical protein NTX50_18650 [Candidatus Sumerlaeota bacterium]|nr:hypothetical protein [Candidatus Sumerlaeota bacterium]